MLNLLIVDDNKTQREGIKFLMNKYNLDLCVTEAENGIKALEILKTSAINILLTDIKMPHMDGIELSKQARQLTPDIEIIFLTAYGEFDYAKTAISLEVSDYLLKPVEVNEFLKVILHVIKKYNEKLSKKKQYDNLLSSYRKGIKSEKETLFFNLIQGNEFGPNLEYKVKSLYGNIENLNFMPIFIDLSLCVKNLNLLKLEEDIRVSVCCYYDCFVINDHKIVLLLYGTQKKLIDLNISILQQNITDYFFNTYNETAFILWGSITSNFESLKEMYLTSEHVAQDKISANNSKIIKQVLDIIKNDYMNDINLDYISERIFLSPSYISYLFKKETGQNVIKYITYYRLEVAKKYLKTTNMKIVDISKKVGYLNTSYFIQTFKQYTKLTPAQYKESCDA